MSAPKRNPTDIDRPNVSLRVDTFATRDDKNESLLRRVEFAEKPGIVYVATHRSADELAAELRQIGVDAIAYHGSLKSREREEIHDRFVAGNVPVVVATNAFSAGEEKGDIRFVYHADVSDSLEAYKDEISVAGRDGEPAEAVLFYRPQDISAQQFKTGPAHVDSEGLEAVYHALQENKRAMKREKIAELTGIPSRKVVGLLHTLEEAGAVTQLESGRIKPASTLPLGDIIEAAEQKQRFQKELRKRGLQQMQGYAECRSCRREYLLRTLGMEYPGPCGNCDRCEEARIVRRAA